MKRPDYTNKLQDLNVLIRSSLKNCEIFNKIEHISLQKKLTPNLPKVRVNADDTSLVIVNLLTNALDSMPNGGKLLIESRHCKEHDSCVQISVSDTGYGIKKNELSCVFGIPAAAYQKTLLTKFLILFLQQKVREKA